MGQKLEEKTCWGTETEPKLSLTFLNFLPLAVKIVFLINLIKFKMISAVEITLKLLRSVEKYVETRVLSKTAKFVCFCEELGG